jgi:hypothetical protein
MVGVLLGMAVAFPVKAQSVEDVLGRYAGTNAQGFLGPLADYLGASFNSGWAREARVREGFSLKLSFVVAGAPIADKNKTFMGTTDGGFSPETTREVPTIFGPNVPVTVNGQGGTAYVFPGGMNASLMATAVPQLSIGSLMGTMVSVRWFGYDIDEDHGKISMLGLGARHDLSQYFQSLPVDLAAGVYWQSLELGNPLSVSSLAASLHVSKAMGILTLYGGTGYETSNTELSFTREGEDDPTVISIDAANSVRFTAGLSLRLAFLELFADYSLASQNAFTIGLGIGR